MKVLSEMIQWPDPINPNANRMGDSFPFIGIRARVTRTASTILKSRNHNQTIRIWANKTQHLAMAIMMLRIVRVLASSYANWPNWYFFPDDCAQIPYCNFRGMNPDFEDVIGPFCEIYGICSADSQCEIMDIIDAGSMFDVFTYVSKHSCTGCAECMLSPYFSRFGLY